MATMVELREAGGKVAKIKAVEGSWGSGMATMTVVHEDGSEHRVHADNGPLIRALESAFGDVIVEGHRFNPSAVTGQEIIYFMDPMGLCMAGFLPVAEVEDGE